MPERELFSCRVTPVMRTDERALERFERNYGPGPRMLLQLGRTDYGWETYMTLGTKQLKELHVGIGAHLAKLALGDAQAQQ